MSFNLIFCKSLITVVFIFIIPSLTNAQIDFAQKLSDAAIERSTQKITYDSAYVSIKYPNGDISPTKGVCTDVVIRSYRKLGVDLQYLIHEDMKNNFSLYPSKRIWGLKKTDKNIDHRRVPNQRVFFTRHGQVLPITKNANDYHTGDIVSWVLKKGNRPHIGIVTYLHSKKTNHPLMVHNVGDGPQIEDVLFEYEITGHYKYAPTK